MSRSDTKRERLEKTELLLETTRTGLSTFELADYLECDNATAYRYLKEIEQRREVIEISRGKFRLDPAQSLSNVGLYPSEALSIYLALRRFIRQTNNAPDFMITAIQKIAHALRYADLESQLIQSCETLHQTTPATTAQGYIWQVLLRGWREKIVVRIQYQKPRETETSEHEIEPYLFEPMVFGHGTYLIAWSQTKQAMRTFKLDRIQQADLTVARFDGHNLDVNDLLKHAWGVWYGAEPTKVELIFVPEVAGRVLETVWHPSETKQLLSDGSLYWSVEVVGTLEILSWIRSWAHEVEVISPKLLREQVIGDLEKALVHYKERDVKVSIG